VKQHTFVTLLVSVVTPLLLVNNVHANEQESFKCPVDQVYSTGSGRSVDMDGGEIEVTVQGRVVTIKNPRINGFGTHDLTLITNTNIEIKGRNRSMIFSLRRVPREFVLHTGIGPSNFSYKGGGHTGKQMRVAGKCSKL
jgi:hypothetical protein